MDMKNEENPGSGKTPFRIKVPSEIRDRMPFQFFEKMRGSWFFQNKMRFVTIAVVLIGIFLAGKMVLGLFKSSKPSLSDTIKQQQQAAKDAPVAVKGFKVGRFNYEDSMNVLGTVKAGSTAPEAAGAIHSDLQKGFIRAELIKYNDLIGLGSEDAVKAQGKSYLKGKDYIVEDGDILSIRFNV